MPDGTSFDGAKVWVAGHRGMVGSALVRRLKRERCHLLLAGREELDLLRQAHVEAWMHRQRPDIVLIAAGKVGGIVANDRAPADFLYENLMLNANILAAAHETGVGKLVALGSSCIYPRAAAQPIAEGALLSGPLEPTNEGYAVAKIAAIKLTQYFSRQYGHRFIALMPTNLYGPNDNFDPESSHVLPAMIRKFSEAIQLGADRVTLWGSGTALREFLHVDDLADACIYLAARYDGSEVINVGSGEEISIGDLARLVADTAGFHGEIHFDRTKPDGAPRKRLDTSRLAAFGWQSKIPLRSGVAEVFALWTQSQTEQLGAA